MLNITCLYRLQHFPLLCKPLSLHPTFPMWQNTACFSHKYSPRDQFTASRISQNYFASNYMNIRFEKSPTIILSSHKPFNEALAHVFQGSTQKVQFFLHPLWTKFLKDEAPHQQLINSNPGTHFCPLTPSKCQACSVNLELYINIPVKTSDLLHAFGLLAFPMPCASLHSFHPLSREQSIFHLLWQHAPTLHFLDYRHFQRFSPSKQKKNVQGGSRP